MPKVMPPELAGDSLVKGWRTVTANVPSTASTVGLVPAADEQAPGIPAKQYAPCGMG